MKNLEKSIAVVFFNLGGPDKIESVKPFLFNLFNDRAIIALPQPFRFLLAKLISNRRRKKAEDIYHQIGGRSPLLDITLSQADSLERELSFDGNYKVFTIMRYWHPFAKDVVRRIQEYDPHQIILLPLYPQFSSTTSASSIEQFFKEYPNKKTAIKVICCYPDNDDLATAHAIHINQILDKMSDEEIDDVRLLFSAHGLPQKVIDNGDPYVFQVEETTRKTMEKLLQLRAASQKKSPDSLNYRVCYQSKVGPLEWTKPSLTQEIRRIAFDKKIPVIIPISFVSDHSETLVELDIEFAELAHTLGIAKYYRSPSLNINRTFIKGLSDMIKAVENNKNNSGASIFCGSNPSRICPKKFNLCPNQNPCQNPH